MPIKLTLIAKEESGIMHVAAEGEATAADFMANNHIHFDNLLGADWNTRLVLLNLEQTGYLDSSAIGWLIGAQKSFRAGGGMLVLHSVQQPVRQVLDMLKIGRVVPIAADVAAGRALLIQHAAVSTKSA